MAIVHMGYVGACYVTGGGVGGGSAGAGNFYITGSSINPVQELNVPELMQGRASPYNYNWGKLEIGGNITGPLFDASQNGNTVMGSVWNWAGARTTDLDHMLTDNIEIDIAYYKGTGRRFYNCQVNSFEVSITAGDVANFTIDFMGRGGSTGQSGGISGYSTADATHSPITGSAGGLTKLITWDVCRFYALGADGARVGTPGASDTGSAGDDIQSFNMTMANNLQRVYSIAGSTGNYAPFDIVAGMRRLTGSITVYASSAPGSYDAKDDWTSSQSGSAGSICSFDIGGAGGGNAIIAVNNINMFLKRAQAAGKTDVSTYTLDFQAVAFDNLFYP